MEDDQNFASNRIDKFGVNGREISDDRWDALSVDLNRTAAGFYNKTGKEWKEFYNRWRLTVKDSMSNYLIEMKRTGNRLPETETPDNMSWRLAKIYGWEGTGMDLIPESGIFKHDPELMESLKEMFYAEFQKRCETFKPKRSCSNIDQNGCLNQSETVQKKMRSNNVKIESTRTHHDNVIEAVHEVALEELRKGVEHIATLSKGTDKLAKASQKDVDLLRNLYTIKDIDIP